MQWYFDNLKNVYSELKTLYPYLLLFFNTHCVFSAAYPDLQHSCAVYNAVIFGNNNPQRLRDSLPGRYEGKTRFRVDKLPLVWEDG